MNSGLDICFDAWQYLWLPVGAVVVYHARCDPEVVKRSLVGSRGQQLKLFLGA